MNPFVYEVLGGRVVFGAGTFGLAHGDANAPGFKPLTTHIFVEGDP